MKILLAQNLVYFPAFNGASKANRALLEGLSRRGVTCRTIVPATSKAGPAVRAEFLRALAARGLQPVAADDTVVIFTWEGVEIHALLDHAQLRPYVMRQIREWQPTWTVVSSEDPGQILLEAACAINPQRVVAMIHTPQILPCGPQSYLPAPKRTSLLQSIAGVITVSQSVRNYIQRWCGRDAAVFSPPIYGAGPFPDYGCFDAGFITMINPCAIKGMSIFTELAQRLPNIPFAGVPTWGTTVVERAALEALPNVELLAPADDINQILARTRVLVAPSLYLEAFGLIVVEAMLRGIPVLASNVGGLPEAKLGVDYVLPVQPIERYDEQLAGNRLTAVPVVPPQDVSPWHSALEHLLTDQTHYEHLSNASREAAHAFAASLDVATFEAFLRELAPSARPTHQEPGQHNETSGRSTTRSAELLNQLSPQRRALLALRLGKKEAISSKEPPPRSSRPENPPLSFAQQRLWFLDQLEPDSPFYNVPVALRLRGQLDRSALDSALEEVVRRHEVLRTTFPIVNGQPMQSVNPTAPVPLTLVDLEHLPTADREAEALQHLMAAGQVPFDLAAGPVFRAMLVRLTETDHLLLLQLHHIAADGWSLSILVREIFAFYELGLTAPLPPLPIQYADYAIRQREWLQGPVLDAQLAYWRQQLAGAAQLQLPTDHPRPAVQSFRGARHTFVLSRRVSDGLLALGRDTNVTPFMLLLAAWQVLLHRYSGQTDIVVGTPIANRTSTDIEGLIGFFVNTLVLRTDLSGRPTFREVLSRVRQVAMDAYAHQDLPFERLVEELQPTRDLTRQPLFQVMFAHNNVTSIDGNQALSQRGIQLEVTDLPGTLVKFDLSLELFQDRSALHGRFEYATDLFEATTIKRMTGHLETLLEALVANPDQNIGRLPLLTHAERRQLLVEWNARALPYPSDQRLHHQFEIQAARQPEAVALRYGKQQVTYGELNHQAELLARHLESLHVTPGVLVGVCMERCPAMIVALLAVLKAGGAYVPLDPSYPRERLLFMLEDTAAPLLITQQHLTARLPAHSAQLLCLDEGWQTGMQHGMNSKRHKASSDHLAYVIYTSGSTGRPKGVAIAHRSAVALVHWAPTVFTQADLAGTVAGTSICFDLSVFEIFVPLSWGGAVLLVEHVLHLPDADGPPVTLLNTVPSAVAHLLRTGSVPSSVRTVNLAGEALPGVLVEQLYALGTVDQVFNLYGPSEDTTYSTYALLPKQSGRQPAIGRPIANTQVYLLDTQLEPVPVGVPGEVYIGGAGLAQGYLNRPELTAERFLPDPFNTTGGSRLYRTGDLARYCVNGELEFLGRSDHQVKVRGFRIELGEIETVLRRQAGVQDSVVIVREDEPNDKRIVAYVVPQLGGNIGVKALRHALGEQLPEYMVPSMFVLLDALPLSPNGKIDRGALPAPDQAYLPRPGYQAPRTPVEELLAGIWASVLHLERVGIHDNFWELGGHSLLATQVVARLPTQWKLPLRRIFEAPTVAELAEQIEATLQAGTGLPPLRPVPRDGQIPLSFAQQRLWFLEQILTDHAAYNIPLAVRLEGALDIPSLERALDGLVQRHESLRTTFPARDGQPVQAINSATHLPLMVLDLQQLPTAKHDDEVRSVAAQEVRKPFDLNQGPLLRVMLIRLGPEHHVMLLVMHHIISDAWSLGVLLRDLAAIYAANKEGVADHQQSPLLPLPVQYADFAVWQRQLLQGPMLDELLVYWKKQLAGAPRFLPLPTDHKRPEQQTYNGASHPIVLPKNTTLALRALGQQENVTLFMVLLGMFQVMLHQYTGAEDIVVGTDVANRTRLETEDLVGFFVNQLVLRTDLSGDPTFQELLKRVREACIGAYAHQDLPFQHLVEALQVERDSSRNPLFQVALILQSAPVPSFELRELQFSYVDVAGGSGHFDLLLNMWEGPEGLSGKFDYNADLFRPATVARMAGHLELLARHVTHSDATVSALGTLITEHDRQQQVAKEQEFKQMSLQRLKDIRQRSRRATEEGGEL